MFCRALSPRRSKLFRIIPIPKRPKVIRFVIKQFNTLTVHEINADGRIGHPFNVGDMIFSDYVIL